jgi:dolichol-phosphate mannosyltransferase
MESKSNKTIAIVIPVANEEDTIQAFCLSLLKEAKKFNAKIIFVIDLASKDKTKSILQRLQKKRKEIKVIYAPENRNVVDAYIKGFVYGIQKHYTFIVEMDAGFSHDPKDLSKIVKKLYQGYDCVFTKRPLVSRSYEVPFLRRLYSWGGTTLSNMLFGTHFRDMTSGYNGYKSEVLKKLINTPLVSIGHFWHSELRFRARKTHYVEITIHYTFPSNRINKKILLNSFFSLFYVALKRKA